MWTKPCSISGIVEDSPAGRSHLEPGDFIIFIDKINVVDKSMSEILSIINKSESVTLEVFRRSSVKMQMQRKFSMKIKTQKSIAEENFIETESIPTSTPTAKIPAKPDVETNTNKLVSKGSTESKKKQLVTFSKEEVRKGDNFI